MKHIQLFENFSNPPLYVIDLMEEFPDMYQPSQERDPDDSDSDYYGKGESTLSVFKAGEGETPDEATDDVPFVHVDPSFDQKPIRLKLVVDTTDEMHYGSTNTIFMGVDTLSKESVLQWFASLLSDPSRDYLSY